MHFTPYFHSQTFSKVFPASSASYSKTPTKLFRKDSFPVDDVLKKRRTKLYLLATISKMSYSASYFSYHLLASISCCCHTLSLPIKSITLRNRPKCGYVVNLYSFHCSIGRKRVFYLRSLLHPILSDL
jgi:hypothetical protein